ncbi:MAG: hypothetical protein JOZ17_08615, partial [Acetobacteraceae bacterium]|nr:hypothetical protein [Acetobacteraceae bacterium]
MTGRPRFVPVLRRAIWPLLVFEAQLGLAALVVLDPLVILVLERIVALGSDPFVGNTALIAFALSPVGIFALVTAATGTMLVNILGLGGTGLILWRSRELLPVRHWAVWRVLLGRLPALLAISLWVLAAAALLTAPVLAVAFAARRWI